MSSISNEPWLRLACGAVLQAVDDLCSPDAIAALDALCFWLSDECLWWLDAIGYSPEPERALLLALDGEAYAKKKHLRRYFGGARN